jgi:CheY-like chemotaxis protein
MGGQIGIRSVAGTGSTFWFTAKFAKQIVVTGSELGPMASLHGRHVLVVDDNETNRQIFHHQLAAWGIVDHTVSSGEEALIALRTAAADGRSFEIAILDRQMPGMDGVMLARAIKQDPAIAGVRLVMMTSLGELGNDEDIAAAGVLICLTKPVKHAQIRECLQRSLALPVERVAATPVADRAPDVRPGSLGRVLVAEDNVVNQKVALLQLRRMGYSADAVANGAEAVEALRRIPYDIVLMDCQMPDVDGYEATRIIRKQFAGWHIPIVAMTASALAGDRQKCLDAGMDDYICKPIKGPDLEATLSKWQRKETTPLESCL